MKHIPNLSLRQIYPPAHGSLNINACFDPDCGNFGVHAHFDVDEADGDRRDAPEAGVGSNSRHIGFGKYKIHSTVGSGYRRVSKVFEYADDPHAWLDRKNVECGFSGGARPCRTHFELISNQHLADEVARLRSANGALDGARCQACGAAYLANPGDFILNGVHEWRKGPGTAATRSPARIRVIHRPCKGKPGARFSIGLDHLAQKVSADNLLLLKAIVNGAGITKLMRMFDCGASRVYDRIFWLEQTLLAFEKAQLTRWREEMEASGQEIRHHLAHDDIILGVNWETSTDRRITQLNCSATACVRSGYVFRIDVDFDPTVDPVKMVEKSYVGPDGMMKNLRRGYRQKGGLEFTAPLLSFQRPTGRFEEHHLFASALNKLARFRDTVCERMPSGTPGEQALKADTIANLEMRMALIQTVHEGYFNLPGSVRDHRSPFSGIMTRDIYTKAAHFVLMRETLPRGTWRLITEQEAMLPRLIPLIFREEVEADAFTWLVTTFDKEVPKPEMQARVAAYKKAYNAFTKILRSGAPEVDAEMTEGDRLRAFIAHAMTTAVNADRFRNALPFQGSNFQQPHMPQIWIRSPLQTAGETNKVVGFPLLRAERRQAIGSIPFDGQITDQETRERIAYHVWSATLQPVSTFFNALRERVGVAKRAGGRSARSGPSYVKGASFNPHVLIALVTIFRVYYNWFEPRPYVASWSGTKETKETEPGVVMKRVPGTDTMVPLKKRRSRQPIKRTPAMRLGIQKETRDENNELIIPSAHRILYQPWLYWGTPVWQAFQRTSPVPQGRKPTKRRSKRCA
jgi:hypothetical protein